MEIQKGQSAYNFSTRPFELTGRSITFSQHLDVRRFYQTPIQDLVVNSMIKDPFPNWTRWISRNFERVLSVDRCKVEGSRPAPPLHDANSPRQAA